ncbi:MAG: hypothetical protein O7G86_04480, partial [Gammaproteobacteria bacterium]|nr:hypothetical protein [Gammaproteobacteria bacterium]
MGRSSVPIKNSRCHTTSLKTFTLNEREAIAECFQQYGYAVIKNVFNADEVAALKCATDRVKRRGSKIGRSFRHGNLGYWIKE